MKFSENCIYQNQLFKAMQLCLLVHKDNWKIKKTKIRNPSHWHFELKVSLQADLDKIVFFLSTWVLGSNIFCEARDIRLFLDYHSMLPKPNSCLSDLTKHQTSLAETQNCKKNNKCIDNDRKCILCNITGCFLISKQTGNILDKREI